MMALLVSWTPHVVITWLALSSMLESSQIRGHGLGIVVNCALSSTRFGLLPRVGYSNRSAIKIKININSRFSSNRKLRTTAQSIYRSTSTGSTLDTYHCTACFPFRGGSLKEESVKEGIGRLHPIYIYSTRTYSK